MGQDEDVVVVVEFADELGGGSGDTLSKLEEALPVSSKTNILSGLHPSIDIR